MNVPTLLRNREPAESALAPICAAQLATDATVEVSQFQILPGSCTKNVPRFARNCWPAEIA